MIYLIAFLAFLCGVGTTGFGLWYGYRTGWNAAKGIGLRTTSFKPGVPKIE